MHCSSIIKKTNLNCKSKASYLKNSLYYCGRHINNVLLEEEDKSNFSINTNDYKQINKFMKFKDKYLKNYKVIKYLGDGAFSDVLLLEHNGIDYACKVSYGPKHILYNEYLTLMNITHPNIIKQHGYKFYTHVENKKKVLFEYILLDYCINTLDKAMMNINIETLKIWGFKFIDILKLLHKKNIIYNDFKPDNIMFLNEDIYSIILLDFNCTTTYKDITKNKPKDQIKLNSSSGTDLFNSIDAQNSLSTGRKDDLESLGYLILFIYHKTLPWINSVSFQEILDMKKNIYDTEFYNNSPVFIKEYFTYINTLSFKDEPDYDKLKSIFDDINLLN